jgi:beta-phosphoglucomutase
MDGVLIDSEPAHKLAKERAFAKFGIVLPEAVYERYKGRPDETMVNEVARSIPGRKLDVDELLRIKHSEFEAIEQIAVPIEGAKALVNWAKSRFQVALATSATPRNRQAALSVLGLADTFDFVVDASGFSRPKPDPEIFLTVISGLKAVAAQCLVLEDSLNGVIAGKAAGCCVAAITTSFPKDLLLKNGADHVVGRLKELRALLETQTLC